MEEIKENAIDNVTAAEDQTISEVAAEETVKEERHRKIKIVPLISFISNVFYLVVQVMIMVSFLAGMSPLFGEGFTIVSCINYTIDIFNVSLATAYNYVSGLVFTVIYIIFVAFMIKSVCFSVKNLITLVRITFAKPENPVTVNKPPYMLSIYYPCMRTFFLAFCFTGLANLASNNMLSSAALNCMVFAGICTVLNTVVPQLSTLSKEKIAPFVLSTVEKIIGYIVVCLLIAFINHNVIKELINGFVMLFNGSIINEGSNAKAVVYAIYNNIASPILFIILAAQILNIISKFFYGPGRNIIPLIISQLVYVGVYMVLHLVFKFILVAGAFDVSMVGDWLGVMTDNLLALLLLLVTLLLVEIPFKMQN